jgi:hypothetical protein
MEHEELIGELVGALNLQRENACSNYQYPPWQDRSTCRDWRACKATGCTITSDVLARAQAVLGKEKVDG